MTKLQRIKNYKNREPMETVANIKNILNKVGINVDEHFYHENVSDVDSCHIKITNKGFERDDIGTNGKGMNKEYCLASAYGEFMERLQNDCLLKGVFINTRSFEFFDNEKATPYIQQYAKEVFGENEKVSSYFINLEDKVRMERYSDVFNNKDTFLPYRFRRFLCASTGMASGNTYNEAILQALSEVFERYAMREIFENKIVLPEIPLEYFEGSTVLDRLNQLRDNGYDFRIVDASLNRGLPVVGLVLRHNGKIRSKFGADPSPITSLERCLTEIMQGYTNIDDIPMYEIGKAEEELKDYENGEKYFWLFQYRVESMVTKGMYPKEVFDTSLKPSYEFKGFEHIETLSDEDDLKYYYDILKTNGKKLYIDKKGFMGFPTVDVVVPGMSEAFFIDDGGEMFLDYFTTMEKIGLMKRIPKLDTKQLRTLADNLVNWFSKYDDHKCVENMPMGIDNYYDKNRTISLLYACSGDKEKANYYLNKYLNTEIGQFVSKKNYQEKIERGNLEECFPISEWPICPNCDECKVKDKCKVKDTEALKDKIISTFESKNTID